jgi:hypothetical protein
MRGIRSAHRLHDRIHEKRRVQKLDVDAFGVAHLQARRGIVDRIIGTFGLMRGLARIGHLKMPHEAGQHRVPGNLRLLLRGQLRKRRVVDAEERVCDVHEARRRPQQFGERGVRPFEPVHRFVKVGVDIDNGHDSSSYWSRRIAVDAKQVRCVGRERRPVRARRQVTPRYARSRTAFTNRFYE